MNRYRIAAIGGGVLIVFLLWAWLAGAVLYIFCHLPPSHATPLSWLEAFRFPGRQLAELRWLAGFIAALPGILLAMPFLKSRPSAHGDAHWATELDIRRARLRSKRGVVLGRRWGRYLMSDGFEHVLCFAPTGSGKGVGIVIPNLLNWEGSAIVHDIKGENFFVTSGFRKRHGQKVFCWNPGNRYGETHCYNPLEFISDNPGQRIGDIQKIAHLIVPDQEFWSNEARTLFLGVVLYLLEEHPGEVCFGMVATILRSRTFDAFVKSVVEKRAETKADMLYMVLNAFSQKADRERSGVLSSLNAALELWADPYVDAATARSDFDLRQLKRELITVYVGVTPNDLNRLKPLLQIFYQQAVDILTTKEPDLADEPHGVLFLMDEFASLGRMQQFEKAIAFFRGYRVRLVMIIQDIPQLETHYQRSGMQSFLGNSKIRLTYAANNLETAQLVSRMLGTYGADTESESRSRRLGLSQDWGSRSESTSRIARPLLLPQEIMQLSPEEEIIFVEAAPPIRARKLCYYSQSAFLDRLFAPVAVPKIEPIHRRAIAAPVAPVRELSEHEIQKLLNEPAI